MLDVAFRWWSMEKVDRYVFERWVLDVADRWGSVKGLLPLLMRKEEEKEEDEKGKSRAFYRRF